VLESPTTWTTKQRPLKYNCQQQGVHNSNTQTKEALSSQERSLQGVLDPVTTFLQLPFELWELFNADIQYLTYLPLRLHLTNSDFRTYCILVGLNQAVKKDLKKLS